MDVAKAARAPPTERRRKGPFFLASILRSNGVNDPPSVARGPPLPRRPGLHGRAADDLDQPGNLGGPVGLLRDRCRLAREHLARRALGAGLPSHPVSAPPGRTRDLVDPRAVPPEVAGEPDPMRADPRAVPVPPTPNATTRPYPRAHARSAAYPSSVAAEACEPRWPTRQRKDTEVDRNRGLASPPEGA